MIRPWFESMFFEEMGELWNEWQRLWSDLEQTRMDCRCVETDSEVVVRLTIPELNLGHELDVRVEEERILYLTGYTGDKKQNQIQFTVNIYLPARVYADRVQAEVDAERNQLTIRMPKKSPS
ncbi:MAG: Hsp20 family protein [Firmicutes bacterium]|uniref:Pre-RNA processing PIH1/Nop17 n=1 Tax=Melghirimyces thermohalophilus TaxID=1236220 RepID=A0A1G6MS86_9BACL|nr:Hsp20 family protein [Melghirimyces thermohalophilus]MDA8354548.1 Hsp20 family protein [Bacillota bacterium]SDC57825.1 pre-RNA processing PIH1/Nop17 [Melghirimyces thermohalophilus]